MPTLDELTREIEEIHQEEAASVQEAETTEDLESIRKSIFGKKGRLSLIMRNMGALSSEERPRLGKAANEAKQLLEKSIEDRAKALRATEMAAAIGQEKIDVTLPGSPPATGGLHPLTLILRRIEDIFTSMGFGIELGPDIEDDFHNFEALNFPDDHPARDAQDTLYLGKNLLLRTHTSTVQIHTMQSKKPPLAVIAPGKVYRSDTPDATHSPMFQQVEGFMVDEHIRFSDLKGTLESFIHQMFGENTPYRFRPSFFPFTEPSAEVDIFYERRRGDGKITREWLEILGSGMIHPYVLEKCGIDPEKYQGFAFGMGVERIAMIKYGMNNLNYFFENDTRFLRQFD